MLSQSARQEYVWLPAPSDGRALEVSGCWKERGSECEEFFLEQRITCSWEHFVRSFICPLNLGPQSVKPFAPVVISPVHRRTYH